MVLRACGLLLALPLLPQQAAALRKPQKAAVPHVFKADPTFRGKTMKYSEHLPWVAELFANRSRAEEYLHQHYPSVLRDIRHALADPGESYGNYLSVCGTIYSIAKRDHDLKPYLAAAGGIEVSLKGLRVFLDWPLTDMWWQKYREHSRRCALSVAYLSQYQKDVQEEAGKAGAVEMVLEVSTHFFKHAIMQIGDLQGMLMDFSEANRARWAKAGGLDWDLKTLKKEHGLKKDRIARNNDQAVLNCWYAYAAGTKSPNQRAFAEAGGIEQAMLNLKTHKNWYRVREIIFQALRPLGECEGCEDLQQKLVDAGLLQSLALAMKEVPNDIHIQSPACANVMALTRKSAAIRARAVNAGLAKYALDAVRNFPNMISGLSWDHDWQFDDQYTVYEDCVGALASLADNPFAKNLLKKANTTLVIQDALERRPRSESLRASASKVLAALK